LAVRKRSPRHLSRRSSEIWRSVVAEFRLERHELALLQSALEALDRAEEARATIEREEAYFRDFRGQPKPHPALQQERDARRDFVHLLAELGLGGDRARREQDDDERFNALLRGELPRSLADE
jgi:phage terminase small subunit